MQIGINPYTAANQVRLYLENGCRFRAPGEDHPNKTKAQYKLDGEDMKAYLLETLDEWVRLQFVILLFLFI